MISPFTESYLQNVQHTVPTLHYNRHVSS